MGRNTKDDIMTGNLYHWHACNKLTLVQAALLIVDADPQDWDSEKLFEDAPNGFAAIYQALLHAINEDNTCIGYKLEIIEKRSRSTKDNEWRDVFSFHVLAKDVKRWLTEIGIKSNFFCTEQQASASHPSQTKEVISNALNVTATSGVMEQILLPGNIAETGRPNQLDDKPLMTSERDSLLKLVICMAVQGYSYNPEVKKSGIIAEIKSDLELLGIALNDDTIRSYLKQASAKLPAKPITT